MVNSAAVNAQLVVKLLYDLIFIESRNPAFMEMHWFRKDGEIDSLEFITETDIEIKRVIFPNVDTKYFVGYERIITSFTDGYKVTITVSPQESTLSIQDIYERNKTRDTCISCGRSIGQHPAMGTALNYCKDCCG